MKMVQSEVETMNKSDSANIFFKCRYPYYASLKSENAEILLH